MEILVPVNVGSFWHFISEELLLQNLCIVCDPTCYDVQVGVIGTISDIYEFNIFDKKLFTVLRSDR